MRSSSRETARARVRVRLIVRPLVDVANGAGGKLLCLLGVGSENEFKVRITFRQLFEDAPSIDALLRHQGMAG